MVPFPTTVVKPEFPYQVICPPEEGFAVSVEAGAPAQYVVVPVIIGVGLGLMVMVKLMGVPEHPLSVGVTVICPEIGAIVVLVAVKLLIFPPPAAPRPICVDEFVHVNVVPAGVPVKAGTVTELFAHAVTGDMGFTDGVGFSVTVADPDTVPEQLALLTDVKV